MSKCQGIRQWKRALVLALLSSIGFIPQTTIADYQESARVVLRINSPGSILRGAEPPFSAAAQLGEGAEIELGIDPRRLPQNRSPNDADIAAILRAVPSRGLRNSRLHPVLVMKHREDDSDLDPEAGYLDLYSLLQARQLEMVGFRRPGQEGYEEPGAVSILVAPPIRGAAPAAAPAQATPRAPLRPTPLLEPIAAPPRARSEPREVITPAAPLPRQAQGAIATAPVVPIRERVVAPPPETSNPLVAVRRLILGLSQQEMLCQRISTLSIPELEQLRNIYARIRTQEQTRTLATTPYSADERVENAIRFALRHSTTYSRGRCTAAVRQALYATGVVPYRITFGHGDRRNWAGNTGPQWEQNGFRNLLATREGRRSIQSPYDAPVGAILVYRGTTNRTHMGHVEIRHANGFVSDYRSSRPVGSGFELIGVYVK